MGRFVPRVDLVDSVNDSPEVRRKLRELAEIGAEGARRRAPVDTGELRDSIEVVKTEKGYAFAAGADHALYVELGTFKMAAQPFLRPSLDDIKVRLR